jgi:hypothetical protein
VQSILEGPVSQSTLRDKGASRGSDNSIKARGSSVYLRDLGLTTATPRSKVALGELCMTKLLELGPVFTSEVVAASRRWLVYAARSLFVAGLLAGWRRDSRGDHRRMGPVCCGDRTPIARVERPGPSFVQPLHRRDAADGCHAIQRGQRMARDGGLALRLDRGRRRSRDRPGSRCVAGVQPLSRPFDGSRPATSTVIHIGVARSRRAVEPDFGGSRSCAVR